MRAALIAFAAFAGTTGIASAASPILNIDMCALNAASYTGDLNDNGFVAKLPERIAAGTVTCDRQIMRRLGNADGRAYVLSQAWFTDSHDGSGSPATVAQVAEIDADGHLSIVYRLSEIDSTDEVEAMLVPQDGSTILAITTPAEHFFLLGSGGFAPLDVQWDIAPDQLAADLPDGDLLPSAPGHELDGDIARFNFETFSLDIPIAVAREVFPRTYADPDYDRPLVLSFPLVIKDGKLVPGTGEVIEPEHTDPGGIGETPASFSVPKDTQACEATAWIADTDPAGTAVRATPSPKGTIIATLPGALNDDQSFGADVNIVGVSNGWFLVENAIHPDENYGAPTDAIEPGSGSNRVRRAYRGRGWVHGSRLATGIQSGTSLRASADPQSKSVFDLKLSDDSFATVTGFKSCRGQALELSVKRSDGKQGSGWIGGGDGSRLCSNQATTCS